MKKSKRRGRNAVTMHEVAKHAGVSPMTVSRVISGDANVKPETRKRVEAAIKHFGYSPNVAARNLARAATVHIGLLYNNPSAAYMNELLVGVLEQSRKAGCQILLEKCGARSERTAVEKLVADGVGGIILHAAPVRFAGHDRGAASREIIPFVVIATGPLEGGGLTVHIDEFEAAASMTRYLISLGHRRIGFIRGAPNHRASAERYAGLQGGAARSADSTAHRVGQAGLLHLPFRAAAERAAAHRPGAPQRHISPATTTWRPPPSRWRTGSTWMCPRS